MSYLNKIAVESWYVKILTNFSWTRGFNKELSFAKFPLGKESAAFTLIGTVMFIQKFCIL